MIVARSANEPVSASGSLNSRPWRAVLTDETSGLRISRSSCIRWPECCLSLSTSMVRDCERSRIAKSRAGASAGSTTSGNERTTQWPRTSHATDGSARRSAERSSALK
eukprot:Amastigsp_a842904_61.p3 type:complete len:108 gc:universal Amastigsp_a842904_61:169-492(+)